MATNPFKKAVPFGGKETPAEEEKEHGVKLEKPLESHGGFETPEEEAAEEEEIEDLYGEKSEGSEGSGAMTPRLFVDEVKALLEKLEAPAAKPAKQWSFNEKKLPL